MKFTVLYITAISSIGVMAAFYDFKWVVAYSIFIGLTLGAVHKVYIKKKSNHD